MSVLGHSGGGAYRGGISTILPGRGEAPPARICSTSKRKTPMDIRTSGSAPSRRAPAEYFTGAVWQDPIVEAPAPGNVRASLVQFEPGARTNWHTHPSGQTLYIVSGFGLVQSFSERVREVRAGDVVWFAPNE